MGKRIIVSDADFSANGMAGKRFVSYLYTTARDSEFTIIGTDLPVTSLPNRNFILDLKFRFLNGDTGGMLVNAGDQVTINKPYRPGSAGGASSNIDTRIYAYTNIPAQDTHDLIKNEDYHYKLISTSSEIAIEVDGQKTVVTGVTASTLNSAKILTGQTMYGLRELTLKNSAGVVLMHLLPILDDDNTPCLYDDINGNTIYSAGSVGYVK